MSSSGSQKEPSPASPPPQFVDRWLPPGNTSTWLLLCRRAASEGAKVLLLSRCPPRPAVVNSRTVNVSRLLLMRADCAIATPSAE